MPVTPSTNPQVLESTSPPEKTDLKEIKQNRTPASEMTDTGIDKPYEDITHGPKGLSLSQNTWGKVLNPENPDVDSRTQLPSSKLDPVFGINRDAGKFEETNYFRVNDNVSRERTARNVAPLYQVLAAGANIMVVRGTDLILRVTIRNIGNNYCMIGQNPNVILQNMTDIIFGAAGTVPVAGESVQMEVSTDIWVNSPSGTTILVKTEYARL